MDSHFYCDQQFVTPQILFPHTVIKEAQQQPQYENEQEEIDQFYDDFDNSDEEDLFASHTSKVMISTTNDKDHHSAPSSSLSTSHHENDDNKEAPSMIGTVIPSLENSSQHDDDGIHVHEISTIQQHMYYYLYCYEEDESDFASTCSLDDQENDHLQATTFKQHLDYFSLIDQEENDEDEQYNDSSTELSSRQKNQEEEQEILENSSLKSGKQVSLLDDDWTLIQYYLKYTEKCSEFNYFKITLTSSRTILHANRNRMIQQSTILKTMMQSEMIESKMNEMTINGSIEEEKDFIRVMDFIHVGELGIPILGTSFANLEWFPGDSLIGMKDLLRLIDKADEYGVASLIHSISKVMNEYNVMILLEKAVQISPDLSEILVLQAIDIIASNLSCVIGGQIYNNHLDREAIQIQAQLNTIVNTLIELPSLTQTDSDSPQQLPLLLRIFQSRHCRASAEQLLAIIVVWILSSPFQQEKADMSELRELNVFHNYENSNGEFSKRLDAGISFIANRLDLSSMSSECTDMFVAKVLLSIVSSSAQFKPLQHKLNRCLATQIGKSYYGAFPNDSVEMFTDRITGPIFTQLLFPEHADIDPPLTESSSIASSSNDRFNNNHRSHHNSNINNSALSMDNQLLQDLFSLYFTDNKKQTQKYLQEHSLPLLFTLLRTIHRYESHSWYQLLCLTSNSIMTSLGEQFSKEAEDVSQKVYERKGNMEPPKVFQACMVGLDRSGKTSLLEKMKDPNLKHLKETIPTVGFNTETIYHENVEILVRDIGGMTRIRSLWSHFLYSADLIIYVIDASDKSRYEEAKECLDRYIDMNLAKKDCRVLILANKVDCLLEVFPQNQHQQRTKIMKETYEELVELFENSTLNQWLKQQQVSVYSPLLSKQHKKVSDSRMKEERLKIQLCSARTGEGIYEGFSWLFSSLVMKNFWNVGSMNFGQLINVTDLLKMERNEQV
ncbi:hypothetical protein C9374_004710 [Naegleria lovaniensis]|uniref:BTB domain-containing protein n=1 Tax=Naegleria lovaniensis TaxID=51637 RepID=A0AA88KKS8_NAELO|nr:uncharacterized protein C9374_004710 [Naegleria lovaniensis]KAG2383373.1 hypothetical protein C9374_004710 [Naegleria lovaniensis]